MRTTACPTCSEIIPAEVDYCPFCGNSTRESLMTDDDLIAAQNAEQRQRERDSLPPDAMNAQKLPPAPGPHFCMMCHQEPATIGDYCLECREKLDMPPEQWDMARHESRRRSLIVGAIVAMLLIAVLIGAIAKFGHHARPAPPAVPQQAPVMPAPAAPAASPATQTAPAAQQPGNASAPSTSPPPS